MRRSLWGAGGGIFLLNYLMHQLMRSSLLLPAHGALGWRSFMEEQGEACNHVIAVLLCGHYEPERSPQGRRAHHVSQGSAHTALACHTLASHSDHVRSPHAAVASCFISSTHCLAWHDCWFFVHFDVIIMSGITLSSGSLQFLLFPASLALVCLSEHELHCSPPP